MTAAEIHALYAPLLDTIGWPEGLSYHHEAFVLYGMIDGPLAPAAALCRVKAEDWLEHQGLYEEWFGISPGEYSLNVINEQDELVAQVEGQLTRHHALVAACMAVAEAGKG